MSERRRRTSEYLLPAALFPTLPMAGGYLACPGKTGVVLRLDTVRRVNDGGKPMLRLAGPRLRSSEYPADVTPIPWPQQKRPSRAAEPPDPTDRPAIVTKAMRQKQERERVRKHRLDAADPDNNVRLQNKTASAATWRDPLDVDVLRRKPKAITGLRAVDPLEALQNSGTLNRQQTGAARRLRRDYENGCLQVGGAVDWERGGVSTGGTPVGVSERRLQFLERYQNAQAAMGRMFDIVDHVVLQERLLKAYAALHKIHPQSASGRLYAAIEMLQGHYDSIDEGTERQRPVHTIGPQLGVPAE